MVGVPIRQRAAKQRAAEQRGGMQQDTTEWLEATPAGYARAVALWQGGAVVAFPTETVYGLGADAGNDRAVARIFAAKKGKICYGGRSNQTTGSQTAGGRTAGRPNSGATCSKTPQNGLRQRQQDTRGRLRYGRAGRWSPFLRKRSMGLGRMLATIVRWRGFLPRKTAPKPTL